MKSLVVVGGILTGCATTAPRPTCGPEWSTLGRARAPALHVVIDRAGATPIDSPGSAGARSDAQRRGVLIERVEVTGVTPRFAAELRRELRTHPGSPLADAPLRDDLRRLWKLGVIDDVHVEADGGVVRFVVAPRPTIRRVVRTGGDALAQARFRRLEATSFEPARVRRMAEALRESYERDGRLDARVDARYRPHAAGVDVCVALDPGPRYTIAKLAFPGRTAISQRALLAAMPGDANRVGGLFDAVAFERQQLWLLVEYWERGYLDAHVRTPIVRRRGNRLDVAIPIDEGPQYRLGSIRSTVPLALDLGLRRGAVFARSQVAAARAKLEEALAPHQPWSVVPLTRLDRQARTVDITFEVEWRWPWDALRFWLAQSR